MLKVIRKHNKWLMVGFGVLLMITWLVQPVLNRVNQAYQSRVVGKLDGAKVTSKQLGDAYNEVTTVVSFLPNVAQLLNLNDRDSVHWLMLTREASDAGFIGGPKDGQDWNQLTMSIAFQLAYKDYGESTAQLYRMAPQFFQKYIDEARPLVPKYIDDAAVRQHMTREQVLTAIAKARGVVRMVEAYQGAARMSDRAVIAKAREFVDAAKTDYIFIPADRLIGPIADPDAAALQAHFDLFKSTKPGEGDYGVGYLLPSRIKMEWLELNRAAIEGAVALDPVEVRKRYNLNKGAGGKYPGEFTVERPRIEAEMKAEIVEKIFQEAQVAIQTEVLKAAKILEPDGRYKKLPADWDTRRPRFEAVAQAVVEAVRKATSVTIPLPTVTTKAADWQTRDDLRALPGIGQSQMRAGGLQKRFDDVAFWTRELQGSQEGLIPVQINVPITEAYLSDRMENRYYICILATKGESAPDSIDEKREQIVKDYKSIKAFDQLKAQAEELRAKAVTGGLDAIVAAFPAAEAPPLPKPDAKPSDDAKYKPLAITKDVTVHSDAGGANDPILSAEDAYKKVLEAAAKIDPLLPRDKVPADAATLSIPIAKRLGLVIVRILAPDPTTIEKFRQFDSGIAREAQRREMTAAAPKPEDDPYSFQNLLNRHKYTSGDRDIVKVEDLKKDDSKGS